MNKQYKLTQLAVVYHPGETLGEKLKEMGMSIKEFAIRTTKPEKTIIAVIKGTSSITTEMAVSFENVTKVPARVWLNMQRMYDEYMVRVKREKDAALSAEWMRKFPISEMVNRGWLVQCATVDQKVNALYNYFGISSEKAWNDYYINQELKVAFRISLAHTKDPYAVSAWLRQGELQAMTINLDNPFSEKKLRNTISAMKQIMAEAVDDFYTKLQKVCASIGIKLINTQCLPKAPINGATRWINDTPVIQLSNRYKRYDIFWFTFFHEIGHILLHGKKAIFLEESVSTKLEKDKEAEADAFAANVLLTKNEEQEFISAKDYCPKSVMDAATKYSTHPSVIVGRLQHLKLIKYWQNQSLMKKVEL